MVKVKVFREVEARRVFIVKSCINFMGELVVNNWRNGLPFLHIFVETHIGIETHVIVTEVTHEVAEVTEVT